MGLCLSHESAVRFWLTRTGDDPAPEPVDSAVLKRAEAGSRALRREGLPWVDGGRGVHLLVANRRDGHSAAGVTVHVMSRHAPEGSIRRLVGDNAVVSPELLFAQMCACRQLAEAVELGCYLCSTFSVGESGRGYAGQRDALTSPDALRDFIEALPARTRGVRVAREAVRYVVGSLASPMEVNLAILLALPPELGGWGPFEIVANQPIRIDAHLQDLLGSRYLKGDLYLPRHDADVEFDSREFHTGAFRLDHTQARRNALEAAGVKTVSATYGQMNTFRKFESFVWMLYERLGIPHPEYSPRDRPAQMPLYESLLSPAHRMF